MAVNNMAILRIQLELAKNIVAYFLTDSLIFDQPVIRILPFFLNLRFTEEITFKGRHLLFTENR